jgi:peptide deformylase
MLAVAEAGGVGITAPQTHHSVRISIMCSKPNTRYPEAPLKAPTAVINPEKILVIALVTFSKKIRV